ncbi:uncharacterized protein V1516DRAFT_684390 [Lipomyces oligophaga]|uniref:uncharacterized protein n=1 Tax=Lipomyces oligophaga TaxID=45792 RepID=UPI0034CFB440
MNNGQKAWQYPSFIRIVDFKDARGRGISASCKISKGTIIIKKVPQIMVPNNDSRKVSCARCLLTLDLDGSKLYPDTVQSLISCDHCAVTFYCSLKCKAIDWNKFHKYECATIGKVLKSPFTSLTLLVRLLFLDTQERRRYFGSQSPLISHADKIQKSIARLHAILAKRHTACQETESEILDIYSKLVINGVSVVNALLDSVGLMLDYFVAAFNHSCDPNCYLIFDRGRVIVKAARNIELGEELCISYIDRTMPAILRLETLWSRYHFVCHCCACDPGKYQTDPRNDFKCSKCEASLRPYQSSQFFNPDDIDSIYNPFTNCPSCGIEFANQPLPLGAIDQRLRDLCLYSSNELKSAKEAKELQFKLSVISEYKVVPLLRAPFPNSGQRLISFYVSQGQYDLALPWIGLEYFMQDPELWNLSNHPVGIAHSIRFVVVLLMIVIDSASPASQNIAKELPFLDFGVCVWGLISTLESEIPNIYGREASQIEYILQLKEKFLIFVGSDFAGRFLNSTLEQLNWDAQMNMIRQYALEHSPT